MNFFAFSFIRSISGLRDVANDQSPKFAFVKVAMFFDTIFLEKSAFRSVSIVTPSSPPATGEMPTHSIAEKNTGTSSLANTGTDTTASTGTQSVAHTGTVGTAGETEDIKNHAYNPGTAPAQNAYSPLNYINEQNATKNNVDSTVTNNLTDATTNDLQNQTTHDTTSTTTNDLSRADTGTITDARAVTDTSKADNKSQNETTTVMTAGKLKAYEKLLELLETDVTGEFISKFKICFKQFVMPERHMIYVTEDDD